MKGDFSRFTFDPDKQYVGTLMQQGRVQVDADWNEQQAIVRHQRQIVAAEVIGPHGAPNEGGGAESRTSDEAFTATSGAALSPAAMAACTAMDVRRRVGRVSCRSSRSTTELAGRPACAAAAVAALFQKRRLCGTGEPGRIA